MNKKLLLILMLGMFLLLSMGLVQAQLSSLGTFKQNSEVRIAQVCSDATYINISSVALPNSEIGVSNVEMTSSGSGEFNYTFTSTNQIGRYDVRGISDGCQKTFATYFEITPSGFQNTLGFYFLIIIIMGAFIVLGFSIKDGWFVVVGGMGFLIVGIYSINYGIAGMRDMFMTWGIGLFEIFMGGYLAIRAGLEIAEEE